MYICLVGFSVENLTPHRLLWRRLTAAGLKKLVRGDLLACDEPSDKNPLVFWVSPKCTSGLSQKRRKEVLKCQKLKEYPVILIQGSN